MKLLCDQMLGSLATWLRFLGIDTMYANNKINDDKLLNMAIKLNRVILSQDKQLINRAKKKNITVIAINSPILDIQLKTVLDHVIIDPNQILTRCSVCNTKIHEIAKNKIKDIVPDKVYLNNTIFWKCPKCQKIYWRGTHYNQITEKIKSLKK
jgi:hypothetical protein